MRTKRKTSELVTFPSIETPLGRLHFGGELPDSQGTGFASYRRFGMYALVLVQSGAGYYKDERGFEKRLEPGDLIVVFPELRHQYGPGPNELWDEIFVVFEGEAFDGWRKFGLDPDCPVWSIGNPALPAKNFKRLLKANIHSEADACQILGEIHALIAEFIAKKPNRHPLPPRIRNGMEALSDPNNPDPIPRIARKLGMHPDAFRRIFRQTLGESPAAYRRRQRLLRAENLLRRQDLTLEQIAESLGFTDAFHLSKLFKAQFGLPPTHYRKLLPQRGSLAR